MPPVASARYPPPSVKSEADNASPSTVTVVPSAWARAAAIAIGAGLGVPVGVGAGDALGAGVAGGRCRGSCGGRGSSAWVGSGHRWRSGVLRIGNGPNGEVREIAVRVDGGARRAAGEALEAGTGRWHHPRAALPARCWRRCPSRRRRWRWRHPGCAAPRCRRWRPCRWRRAHRRSARRRRARWRRGDGHPVASPARRGSRTSAGSPSRRWP